MSEYEYDILQDNMIRITSSFKFWKFQIGMREKKSPADSAHIHVVMVSKGTHRRMNVFIRKQSIALHRAPLAL